MKLRLVAVVVAAGAAGCGTPAPVTPSGAPETVYTVTPPTWFEDASSHARVSSASEQMLYFGRFRLELIDIESGADHSERLAGTLDWVRRAVFRGDGIARFGARGDQVGWYVDGDDGPVLTPLPPDAMPAWSADTSRVAFSRPPFTRLSLGMPPNDQGIDVGGRVTAMDWSPDGEFVYALLLDEAGLGSLIRVAADGSGLEMILEGLDAPDPRIQTVAVSPDGRSVFVALASGATPDPEQRHRPEADRDLDIYAFHLETGELRRLTRTPGDDFGPGVAGSHLYWTHNDFRDEIVLVPTAETPAGGDSIVSVLGDVSGIEEGQIPYWSPDGRQIGFTYGGWRLADWALNLDAAVVAIDDSGRAISAATPIVVGYHEDFTPAWSPDGRWIAYHSHRSATPVPFYAGPGVTDDIYIRRPEDPPESEIRLTDFGWEVGMADWAPDGRRLIFDSWDREGEPGISEPWIATIDPQSGEAIGIERLPLPEGFVGALLAAWSPVAEEVAIVERVEGTAQAIWVLAVDGSRAERIIEFEASTYGGIDWMPDGREIVYGALAGGRMQLFAVPRAGGDPRQLTEDEANLIQPQVSPDGRWIAASRLHHGKEVRRVALR